MKEDFQTVRLPLGGAGVFMFINLTIQILWITYAPITGLAAEFYGVTDLQIGLAVDGLYDRLSPALHSGFVGDRHLWIPDSGWDWRGSDG